ncbi:flagellar basal body P-ring formation chaperone FlgA [Pseudidiomarina donghaiensis]|uniref:Flagella basal body P-ring formation protein FlgA n=1 Tax=Pseudidiomarina donghaiensis TaxID=519452 RepID=A0A432XGM2_9GAMM|nr:flagellar basal body P-ring formation chaperone FlgA [Pseudidiomarina donghaiensis]RUO47904.1 flagella basal body P-ring formation protein FlgA [Pseudidiomarina donghaiensis]SFV22582.1 Chaperone for flagella basal body P-ring formation [Pseudidiomarina donghaiensis]
MSVVSHFVSTLFPWRSLQLRQGSSAWQRFTLVLLMVGFIWASPAQGANDNQAIEQSNWYRALAQLVQEHLPTTTTSYNFELLTPTETLAPLQQCQKVHARFTRAPQRLAGRTMVTLSCSTNVRENPRFAQIDIAVTGNYLVVTRDLAAKHTLTRNDITIEQGDLGRLPRYALLATPAAMQEVIGQQLRRALSQHSVLQENLLTKPQVVGFGDELVIEASGQGFQITRTAEAMDTGAIGDIIRVRLNNKQLMRVKIIAPGRAEPAQ